MKKVSLLIASALASTVIAQTGVGVASQVEGLVTVSQGQNVGLLQPGTGLADGARVVTGSTGSTVIQVSANCQLRLGPNQSVVVAAGKACAELVSSIENLAPIASQTQFAGLSLGSGVMPVALVAAGTVGLVGAVRSMRSAPISAQ